MKQSKKTSDTSIRVLETLKVLSKEKMRIQDIINHFEKIDPENRIYTNEVILKYLNTLKVFGFRIIKEKDQYVLLNMFNQFSMTENDLSALMLIEKSSKQFPEEKIKQELTAFVADIERRLSDSTKINMHKIKKLQSNNLNFEYTQHIDKIKEYEKYCIDGQRLKISYRDKAKNPSTIIADPIEIKYVENNIFLSIYSPTSAQIQNLNFNLISKVEQLPLKSNASGICSCATFALKGRLAKAYKLHESERLLEKFSDEHIVILNQKEDRTSLLKRLMKYGDLCEVISPKSLREEMQDLIKMTLKQYI